MTEKRERFVKLAESRTRKAIKDLSLIGNLANKSSYSYQGEDVNKIFGAIENAVRVSKRQFEDNGLKNEAGFSL